MLHVTITQSALPQTAALTLRYAADIDRQADHLLSVGQFLQAERLAHLAADLRSRTAEVCQ